jgi:hypothetical protein
MIVGITGTNSGYGVLRLMSMLMSKNGHFRAFRRTSNVATGSQIFAPNRDQVIHNKSLATNVCHGF